MVVVRFANGKEFKAKSIDDVVKQCLASGHDPYKPTIVEVEIAPVIEEIIEPIEEVKPKSKTKK